jgi:hypothetical protein
MNPTSFMHQKFFNSQSKFELIPGVPAEIDEDVEVVPPTSRVYDCGQGKCSIN